MRGSRVLFIRNIALALFFPFFLACRASAGETAGHQGFVVSIQSGYGHLHLRSDQGWDVNKGTFSLGFQGGYAVTPGLVLGLEVNGWLLEPFTINAHGSQEERGEAVSNTVAFIHLFPISRWPIYVRAAVGHAHYKNNRPEGVGGGGWGSWLLGGGYEVLASDHFYIAPQVSYGGGHFGDVPDILGRKTGRRYDVVDISVAMHWYSGK